MTIKEKNQAALDQAARTHYFVRDLSVTKTTTVTWRKICIDLGIPFVSIEKKSRSKFVYLRFHTDTLFNYAARHDFAYPAQNMTPTEELEQQLDIIMHRYPFNGGWSSGSVYMTHISFEQAEDIVHDLLALWEHAKQHPKNAWITLEEERQLMIERQLMTRED